MISTDLYRQVFPSVCFLKEGGRDGEREGGREGKTEAEREEKQAGNTDEMASSRFSPQEKQCPNCESANSCKPPAAATLK